MVKFNVQFQNKIIFKLSGALRTWIRHRLYTQYVESILKKKSETKQAMTEAAIFTIGRSRIISYSKFRPLADYEAEADC